MLRSVVFLVHVLSIVAPRFQPRQDAAVLMSRMGESLDLDPLTVVAYVEGESQWQVSAINEASGTRGLGQIQPQNFQACQTEGKECDAVRQALVDWNFNLTTLFHYFANNRAFCKEKEHTALAIYWLQVVKGYDAVRRTRCGHFHGMALRIPKGVKHLMARRHQLEKL